MPDESRASRAGLGTVDYLLLPQAGVCLAFARLRAMQDAAGTPAIPVLNLIGPVGIGKSSVADAISEVLEHDYRLPHAVIDLDHVRRCYPSPDDDEFQLALGFANLAAIWKNYAAAGAQCLIIPSLMGGKDDFGAIRAAVPGAEIFVVRLTASLGAIHARIRRREVSESSLHWYLQRAADLVAELPVKRREDAVVDTEGRSPSEIARETIAQWGILDQLRASARKEQEGPSTASEADR
jgi:adenylylsulfate kinase